MPEPRYYLPEYTVQNEKPRTVLLGGVMSGDVCGRAVQTPCVEGNSRIPVASPSYGFRRCSSMRLRGERRPQHLPLLNGPEFYPGDGGPEQRNFRQHHLRAGVTALTARPPIINGNTAHQLGNSSRTRSLSLSLSTTRLTGGGGDRSPGAITRRSPGDGYLEDGEDVESVRSYASGASTASCEHPFVAHNGTTWSGRRMKYVVHCSAHAGQTGDEYLTPTQRAQRQIKRLKHLLGQAKKDLEQKDSDIFRLTKEVVELRLYKAQINISPDSPNSSEAVTVRDAGITDDAKTPDSPTCCTVDDFTEDPRTPLTSTDRSITAGGSNDMHSSCADSGHFEEDLHASKDSIQTCDRACLADFGPPDREAERKAYENRLEELIRAHQNETDELKRKHNDRIEELLHKLSDVNIRYCQLVPDYEQARERIQELEKQLDEVTARLEEQENKQGELYLQMYNKGVQTAKFEQQEQLAVVVANKKPSTVTVAELLQQLQVTQTELENIRDTEFTAGHSQQAQSLLSAKEAVSLWVLGARKAMYRRLVESQNCKTMMDPEVTLQFLKSAIYYFLTDKENNQGHLKAIQSILGFSPTEISNIDKARSS